ncbi:anthranilate synthase component I family protein [Rohdeia mirabilis]
MQLTGTHLDGSATVRRRRTEIVDPPRPEALLRQVGDERRPILFAGSSGRPARHAWLCFDPVRVLDGVRDLDALRSAVRALELVGDDPAGPFLGGFAGVLAYDLGPHGEALDLPPDPWGWPPIVGGLYTDLVHWDLVAGTAELILREGDDERRSDARRAELLACIERAREGHGAARSEPACDAPVDPLERRTSAERFRANVERARTQIADGSYYQANLSHRFTTQVRRPPHELYEALTRTNPAPYMGYMSHPGGAILSSSPELLFEFDGRVARSRPIKGTCKRALEPEADERAARALLASAKDRAELAMIVDLVRNDLGRVATAGGVSVPEAVAVETFSHVHHLVGTIEATVRPDVDAFDVLAALFPGGSITGAPKLAAMDAIAVLEGEGRGPFTGSLGWIGTDGAACFNILIRTLLTRPIEADLHEVSFRVGGGITWRSDPWAEDEETLAKAEGLVRALESDHRDAEVKESRGDAGGAIAKERGADR